MNGPVIPTTIAAALRYMRDRFAGSEIETPGLDARLLLEWVMGADRLSVLSNPQRVLNADELSRLSDALARRIYHEPVHRIIGNRDFYGLKFELSTETLEPRSDTECLVDLVLEHLVTRQNQPLHILDLGTGTGIIAISLLSQLSSASAVAVDISADALATTLKNGTINDVASRLTCLESNWFEAVRGRFDLIVSNPPYIASTDISGLSKEVRNHDPRVALDGGEDGLSAYRVLAKKAVGYLNAKGLVAVEIGFDQIDRVAELFAANGFVLIKAAKDLAGRDRAMIFSRRE